MSAFPVRLERLRSRSLAPLLLLSASFGPGAALAEDAEAPVTLPPVTVTGERPASAGLALDVPSTGGSRLGLAPLETPASVEVISGQTIRDRGQTSVTEAVTQNATGFSSLAAPGNGGSSLATRGFAGHGSVMQLYDGTRLYVGSGTVTFPFDTWSAERIEVLRGPASVLYGEGAIGGVVNLVPKRPTTDVRNEAMVAIGTDAQRRAAFGSGGPLSETLSYRLDVSGNRSNGWVDRGGTKNLALSGAVTFRATPDVSVTLSNDYGDQQPQEYFGTPLINGGLDRALRHRNFNVGDSAIRYRDNWTQLKAEWTVSDALTLRNTAYHLTSHRHWKNVESYAWNAATRRVDRSSYIEIYHDQRQVGDRFDATWRSRLFGMRNELVGGFDVNQITFKNSSNSAYGGTSSVDPFDPSPGLFVNLAGTRPRVRSKTDQYALFLEDRLSVTDRLALVGGLRYDAPSIHRADPVSGTSFDKDVHATSWRAGTVYEVFPGLALYGQYATAVDPVGNLISLSAAQKDFDLSTGRQVEVGVKQSFLEGRGEWTLAAYHIVKDKLLTTDPNQPGVTIQVGQQSSRGLEASLSLGLWEGVRVDVNGALLRAKYDDFSQTVSGRAVSYVGNVPAGVPERTANAWASWAFLPGWEARAGVQYVGKTYADAANTAVRPAYTVVNAGLDYRPTANTKLSLRAFNLFDEVYAVSGGTTSWVLGRPRSAELAFSMTF
ncbi:TonB-dependent siderophore receptor [Roseomonas genomospecies 6]|uniref:TonB-dependent siderophore receptor n=1 Tax=Roseomonas genomospecies 6 TaxID=214106 RepID=A0A9W7NGJ7_9PROT|nr:TonB-dependent siderophore receptor [Roseomonas genomospecies 6]KAA0677919.1 TonB-dependent siderophore receptor [Roseomonas genomospecies 6]